MEGDRFWSGAVGPVPAKAARSRRDMTDFHDDFVELFHRHFHRLYRCLDRLSGDPDLAADLAQDAFLRLYQRGSPPDAPEAWLITVGMNLLRNARSTSARRARLLRTELDRDGTPAAPGHVDRSPSERVRAALDAMPERERQILLLRAEGYSYRDIAAALALNEASVGTLLARAKQAFRDEYGEMIDAP
jgi:RNA polymerase sigma-70 factor (ECF subfamily)